MNNIYLKQKKFFQSGFTLEYNNRIEYLKKLKRVIIKNEKRIEDCLKKDLGKSSVEAYMTEIGLTLEDISFQIKNMKKNCSKIKVKTPMSQFPSKTFQVASPYGNVLIISPWNYPFLLSMQPLVGAIAAGNTVILKPSEYSVNTSNIMKEILSEVFSEDYVYTALGDSEVASKLLSLKFDYIFFTGGTSVGKIVYESAAKNLTPVTLELGGKSPVIIEKSAKIDLACKRIVFGKYLNCGQSCVAPDYILVDKSIVEEVKASLIKWIDVLFKDALNNNQYGNIINERHFKRLLSYLDNNEIIKGGKYSESSLKIEPTLIIPNSLDEPVMQNEIFGPILPIIVYDDKKQMYDILNKYPTPLACYIFTTNKDFMEEVIKSYSFGGGCINDTIIHLAITGLPFGGVGSSGIGQYHGQKSFETFSHYKSIVNKSNRLDINVRYTPYNDKKEKMIKKLLH